jgi:hypothetical protein
MQHQSAASEGRQSRYGWGPEQGSTAVASGEKGNWRLGHHSRSCRPGCRAPSAGKRPCVALRLFRDGRIKCTLGLASG